MSTLPATQRDLTPTPRVILLHANLSQRLLHKFRVSVNYKYDTQCYVLFCSWPQRVCEVRSRPNERFPGRKGEQLLREVEPARYS